MKIVATTPVLGPLQSKIYSWIFRYKVYRWKQAWKGIIAYTDELSVSDARKWIASAKWKWRDKEGRMSEANDRLLKQLETNINERETALRTVHS